MWHRLYFDITFAHCFDFTHIAFIIINKHQLHNNMKCLECSEETRKYKCTRCARYWWVFLFVWELFWIKTNAITKHYWDFSCSFECFKKHKNAECTPAKTKSQEKCVDIEARKPILQFTTEDTVDPEKLAQLGEVQWKLTPLRNFFFSSKIKQPFWYLFCSLFW